MASTCPYEGIKVNQREGESIEQACKRAIEEKRLELLSSSTKIREELVEEPGSEAIDDNFRLANKWLLLTYKTHLDKDKYIEWLKEKTKGTVTWIRLAHENADAKAPYEHTHVVTENAKTFNTKSCRYFDYNGIHPNVRRLKCKRAFTDAKIYIAKEDPANSDLKAENQKNIVEAIMKCDTTTEALMKYCAKPNDAPGIIAIRNETTINVRRRTKIVEPTHKWQQELLKMVEVEPSVRDVIWIYDKKGCAGKSTFTRYIKHTMGSEWYSCTEVNQCKDLAPIIMNAIEGGWKCWGWIFDLPRDASDHKGFYSGIECLKNGEITGTKYRGRTVEFDIPHVVIFANFLPKTHTMSMDRWKIFEIQKDMSMISVNAYKVHSERYETEEESSYSDTAYTTLGSVSKGKEEEEYR